MTHNMMALTIFLLVFLWAIIEDMMTWHQSFQRSEKIVNKNKPVKILWKSHVFTACEKALFLLNWKEKYFFTGCEKWLFHRIFTGVFSKAFCMGSFLNHLKDTYNSHRFFCLLPNSLNSWAEPPHYQRFCRGRLTSAKIEWTKDSTGPKQEHLRKLLGPSKDFAIVYCFSLNDHWKLFESFQVSILQRINLLSLSKDWAIVSVSWQSCLNPEPLHLLKKGFNLRRDRSHQQLWNWLQTDFSTVAGKIYWHLHVFLWDMFWLLQKIELLLCVIPSKDQSTVLVRSQTLTNPSKECFLMSWPNSDKSFKGLFFKRWFIFLWLCGSTLFDSSLDCFQSHCFQAQVQDSVALWGCHLALAAVEAVA